MQRLDVNKLVGPDCVASLRWIQNMKQVLFSVNDALCNFVVALCCRSSRVLDLLRYLFKLRLSKSVLSFLRYAMLTSTGGSMSAACPKMTNPFAPTSQKTVEIGEAMKPNGTQITTRVVYNWEVVRLMGLSSDQYQSRDLA